MALISEESKNPSLPKLVVQAQSGDAPDYSDQLYRLFLADQKDINLNLNT